MLWAALLEAEHLLFTSNDADQSFKAIHALATVGGSYAKLLETVDIAERLKTLEAQLAGRGVRNGHLTVGGN
jgi:hypothetical protein